MRENQFEKGLEQLEAMERKNIPIENWLHSLIIYILCDHKEFEEISRLVRRRLEQGHEMTPQLLSHLLDKAGEARHHELSHYIWERKVNLGYVHPSMDTCTRTLNTAARHRDPQLAQAVFHYLGKAGLQPKPDNHNQVIKSHLTKGSPDNLLAVFKELCTMHEAGLKPQNSTMRQLCQHFITWRIDCWEAWQMLKRLKDTRRSIPMDAIELILQAWKNDAKHNPSVADDALQLYREIYTVYPDGANLSIFNSFINICQRAQRVDLGMYMLKEMASSGIIPSGKTFELVIRMCLDAGSFKSAWMYLQDMQEREFPLTPKTQELIQEICLKSVDPYALRLRYHPSAQLPVSLPAAEPAKPDRPGKVVWNKEPKPSQATRRRRRRQREARIAEIEARREGTVVSEKK
jgi:pentatricopeptide repeat protein